MKRKRIFDLVLLGLGLLGLLALVTLQVRLIQTEKTTTSSTIAGSPIGGPFTLIDQDGTPRTEKDLAGRYNLIYFGFTFCPAICPTELQKMTRALEESGKGADKIQPIFITIDPERDTQAVMKTYISQFDPRFMGLTGTKEQIDDVLKSYRVYARKVEDPSMTDYTMDHSSYIYLIGPDGLLLGAYGIATPPTQIAADIKKYLTP